MNIDVPFLFAQVTTILLNKKSFYIVLVILYSYVYNIEIKKLAEI